MQKKIQSETKSLRCARHIERTGRRGQAQIQLSKPSILFVQAVALLALLHCPKELPHQELAEARLHLAAAKEEGANAQDYAGAQEALFTAHDLVAQEDFDDAKEKAQEARGLALDTREKAMPAYLTKLTKEADLSLASMEKNDIAKISPEEFQTANNLYSKGQISKEQGDKAKARAANATGDEKYALRREALSRYRSAALAYKEVLAVSVRVDGPLKARTLDLGEAIKAAQADLKKARLYGATASQLKGPQTQLNRAQRAYAQKKHSEAAKDVEAVRQTLAALLTQLEPLYAKKMLGRARKAVARAEGIHVAQDTPQAREDAKKARALDAMQEQVASAQEARDAAANFLKEENYEESIKESEDALRLSQVILEQSKLVAAGRGASITGSGDGLVEDIGEGWKRYTVRDLKPADCLWCIAAYKEVYGSGILWERIYKANRKKIRNPNLIRPGLMLFIPPREGTFSKPPVPSAPASPVIPEDKAIEEESAEEEKNATEGVEGGPQAEDEGISEPEEGGSSTEESTDAADQEDTDTDDSSE